MPTKHSVCDDVTSLYPCQRGVWQSKRTVRAVTQIQGCQNPKKVIIRFRMRKAEVGSSKSRRIPTVQPMVVSKRPGLVVNESWCQKSAARTSAYSLLTKG